LTTDGSYLIPVGFYTGRRELSWPTRVNGIPVVWTCYHPLYSFCSFVNPTEGEKLEQ
jgi:hypothetical protein